MSLRQGTVPSALKDARVTPIFKSGDKESVNNYRPISVLPVVSKILERHVHNHLYNFLSSHNLITDSQSGFRPLHSTSTALIKLYDDLLTNMNNGQLTGMVFIDLRKAFDTVNHEILLQKLKAYGTKGLAHQWFTSYLTGRTQRVDISGSLSDSKRVTTGVPQGSILGPLLFILFVNDMESAVTESSLDLYADDTSMKTAARDINTIRNRLSRDLARLSDWLKNNRLILNLDKTVCMLVGTRQRISALPSTSLNLTVQTTTIAQATSAKLLGVIIDSVLSWENQVKAVTCQISQRLGLIRRLRPVLPRSVSVLDS